MGSENVKRVSDVGKGRGRFARIFALVVLAVLLSATPAISFTAIAGSEENVDVNTVRATGTTYYTPSESILDSAANVPANLAGNRYERAGLPMTMVPIEGLEDLLQPGYADGAFEDKGTGPSLMGESDPEPNDAPFLTNDVLVYSDPGSQRNPSIGHWDNGDIMVSYDTPGTGGADVFSSLSTDGGANWNDYPIVADAGEDEACASIAGDDSPIFGGEMFYAWYSNPTMEFSWTTDGMTWAPVDFGASFWATVSCPYVAVQGDAIVIVAQKYDDVTSFQDTWYILYTLDNFQTTLSGYYWIMWTDGLAYRPRVTITDVAGSLFVMAAVDIYDVSVPGSEWHDTLMAYGELTGGGPGMDTWDYWVWGSGFNNQIYSNPTIASDGANAVVVTQEVLDPLVIPVSTGMLFCAWTDVVGHSGATWSGCNNDAWFLAFDGADTKDQKYPHFHREGATVHAVWVNGTDINYKFSPDGGNTWNGDMATGDPMKVNEAGVGTHLDVWHSPDIDIVAGKPSVAWHDTRGGDDIYFQSFGNVAIFQIDTQPSIWDLWVREVGDASWHPPPYSYLWTGGTNHDVETIGNYEIPNDTRYTFNQWDDGSGTNPTTINVGADTDIVAIYDVEYYLTMINPGGTTTPVTGYQAENGLVTIEAFAPPAPPGARYVWLGWTGIGAGSYTGAMNPCVSCVAMIEPATQIANWQLQWEVNFFTQPAGLVVEVGGQLYGTPHQEWFNDSEMYSINVPSPQAGGPGLQYVFTSWSDAGPQSHNVFVMAANTNFTATLTAEYWLTVDTNVAGLTVRVNGMDYPGPYSFWCPQWSRPWLEAVSPQYLGVLGERYVWSDWDTGGSQTHQHNCSAIATVTANYVKQYSVNITTSPGGLGFNVIVDGQPYATPAQFWWNESSMHDIEALATIPVGANNRYNWTDWSDFGAMVHQVAPSPDLMLVANYDFQHKITLQSNSPGTIVELDSSPIALPYVYWCTDGSSHILNAPDPQTFGDTRYIFNSWSDSGAQMHNIVCSAPSIVQVNFDKEYRVYINTTLDSVGSNLDVIAGVATYPTPAEIWWPADTMMALDTNEFQPGQNPANGIRYKFGDWVDSGIKSRTINVNAPGLAYVANFGTQFKLMFVDPHGVPTTTPGGDPVTDGIYFDTGTSVTIGTDATVADTADHRWRFDGWSSGDPGGFTGAQIDPAIIMSGPITQTAAWMDQYKLTIVSPHGTPDVTGEAEEVTAFENWFDAGTQATFTIEAEVFTNTADTEKAVFDSWTGGTSPATMNAPLTVTATWHNEYLVTVVSGHGTVPAASWIVEDATYSLTIEDTVTSGDTRYVFGTWTTGDLGNGGYQGTSRQTTLTVTGAITETATWTTEHRLTIVSSSGDETGIGEPGTVPPAQEWVVEGTVVTIEVDKTVEIGDTRYTFKNWVGAVADPNSPTTTVTVNSPTALTIEWDSEPTFSIMDLWWLFVVIIIIVVALVAVLLMKRKKPAEEEIPPPEDEEFAEEEAPAPEE